MTTYTSYQLNAEGIDKLSADIEKFLGKYKTNKRDILRVRIGMEEALLRYQEIFGEQKEIEVKFSTFFGILKVSVSIEGDMYDPLSKSETREESSAFMRSAMANMGQLPIWKYSRGTNVLTYSIAKHHIESWVQLIIAIALAFVCATILKMIPQNITEFIHGDILSPLLDTFMNLLTAIAGPMIFLAVVWGIYSIGDVSAFSVLGKRLLGRLLLFVTVLSVITGLVILPFFNLVMGEAQLGNSFSDIFKMILNIAPGNIILPFSEGNTLQVLFIGIVMGIAMIMLGERTSTVAIFAEQLNYIVQIIMEFISKLVPFFVFGSLLDIMLSNQIEDIAISYKLFFSNAGACLGLVIIYIISVCATMKVSPLKFIKKSAKTLLICLTTASSAAAFSTSLSTCKDEYGIDESLTNFGVPFSQVIFKPSVAILYFTSAIYVAEAFGVPVSTTWFVTAFLMSILLSVATPPIPGGALASITVLFTQLGLPTEGIAVVLALNIVLDFIETPTDVFGGQSVLILAANRFRMINKKILRK